MGKNVEDTKMKYVLVSEQEKISEKTRYKALGRTADECEWICVKLIK